MEGSAGRQSGVSLRHLQCVGHESWSASIENLWLLAGPFINNQYPQVRRAHSEVHPHLMIIDALSRKSPSEAGELAVRDLREGSYLILETLKNTGAQVSPLRRKNRTQPLA